MKFHIFMTEGWCWGALLQMYLFIGLGAQCHVIFPFSPLTFITLQLINIRFIQQTMFGMLSNQLNILDDWGYEYYTIHTELSLPTSLSLVFSISASVTFDRLSVEYNLHTFSALSLSNDLLLTTYFELSSIFQTWQFTSTFQWQWKFELNKKRSQKALSRTVLVI